MALYRGYTGIVANKIETTILVYLLLLYRGYMGIMEKKMQMTIIG